MRWYLTLHSANMCLLLCLEPLPSGRFVGNSEQGQVPPKSKVTVLSHVGWVAEVQPHPFLGREGKCQLCSPLSSAQCVPGQSHSIWQSSLLKMELYHIQVEPQERTVAIRTKPNSCPFPRGYWLHTILGGSFASSVQPWYWKSKWWQLVGYACPAHPPPLARPRNETFTQQHNLDEAKCFSSFPSKIFPNLTAELQAPSVLQAVSAVNQRSS